MRNHTVVVCEQQIGSLCVHSGALDFDLQTSGVVLLLASQGEGGFLQSQHLQGLVREAHRLAKVALKKDDGKRKNRKSHSLVVWSDGGKHFRCNATIATITLRGLECLSTKSELMGMGSVDICFGVPNHFKNRCDGAQAYCRAVLDEARKQEHISDIREFITHSRRIHEEHRADPSKENVLERMPCEWIDFFPDQEKKEFRRSYMFEFATTTFLQPISICQAWQGRCNDIRRRPVVLWTNPKTRSVTAVTFKALMLRDGSRCPADRQTLPELRDLAVEEVEEGEGEADGGDAAEMAADFLTAWGEQGSGLIQMAEKKVLGWATSYRTSCPELRAFATWRARWSKARIRFQDNGIVLKPGQNRRPAAEAAAMQEKWRQNRRKIMRRSEGCLQLV